MNEKRKLLNFLIWFSFLFTVASKDSSSLTLYCKFHGASFYSCVAIGLENHQENLEIFKVSGKHVKNKTNSDVEGLVIKEQNVSYVPRNIAKFFPKLTSFEVKNSSLIGISRENFAGLHQLESLELTDNQLEKLNFDVFYDSSSLKHLRLHGNKLTTIHYKTFTNSKQLEVLALDGNQIEIIHEELLINLAELKEIYLHNNAIEELRERTFAGNLKLVRIDLSNNKLKSIGPQLLDGLSNLKHFNFSNNVCITVDDGNLTELKGVFYNSCLPSNIRRFEEEIKTLKAEKNELNSTREDCESQLEDEKASATSLQSDLQQCQDDKETNESQLTESKSAEEAAVDALKQCQSDKSAKEDELAEAAKNSTQCEGREKSSLQNRNLIRSAVASTSDDISNCMFTNVILTNSTQQKQQQIEQFKRQLEDAMKKNRDDKLSWENERNQLMEQIDELKNNVKSQADEIKTFKSGLENLAKEAEPNTGSLKPNLLDKKQETKAETSSELSQHQALIEKCHNDLEDIKASQLHHEKCQIDLKTCVNQLPTCNSFFILCKFQEISQLIAQPDSTEYVCRAKHVSACQPGMKLTSVEGTHFHGKKNYDVNILELTDSIFQFTNDIFIHLPNLKKIKVKNGGVATLKPQLKSSNLIGIDLEGNQINEVPSEAFLYVDQLQSLLLVNNKIEKLNVDSFKGLSALKELSLQDNKISEIPKGAFDMLTQLTHLSIKNNKLNMLHGDMLHHNKQLEVAQFDFNSDISFIGSKLLDFSKELKIVGFDNTCVGDHETVEDARKGIIANCQKLVETV